MKLRTHLIMYMKTLEGGILGCELERKMFQTSKGGYFSASTISRQARHLAEEERLERNYDDKGLVTYKYSPSKEEIYHSNRLEL